MNNAINILDLIALAGIFILEHWPDHAWCFCSIFKYIWFFYIYIYIYIDSNFILLDKMKLYDYIQISWPDCIASHSIEYHSDQSHIAL